MSKQSTIKLVNEAFMRLAGACEHTHDWDRYMDIHRQEEKDHRRFEPDHVQAGLTQADSVRLFAVKTVFERFTPPHSGESIFTPQATDYLHIKRSVFAACSIAHSCGEEIVKEFTLAEMSEWLRLVDYVELNKPKAAKYEQNL